MAKLLLLAESNYHNNIKDFGGKKIQGLEFKSCQSKQVLMGEIDTIQEGILVVACLDMIAAEASTITKESQDRAVELHYEHVLLKIMEKLENAGGKLACGILAPIYWKTHSPLTRRGMHHAYSLYMKSPVRYLFMTEGATDFKVGADGVHLVPRSAKKYIEIIHALFFKIDESMGKNLVKALPGPEKANHVTWANEEEQDDGQEEGFPLDPPVGSISPSRTLSMVSVSMLQNFGMSSNPTSSTGMVVTGANRIPLGSGVTGFNVPPPGYGQQQPPVTWPTMLTPELATSLGEIEQRLGKIEVKSFFDNLKMASLQEEQDSEANRAMLSRVTITGLKIPGLQRMRDSEKVPLMREKVQQLVDSLAGEDQKFEVGFVRHQNRQVRGQSFTVIEAKLGSEMQASELRASYIKKKAQEAYEGINITPVVRLATRVRVEVLYAVARLIRQRDPTVIRVSCLQFIPKPVLKIVKKDPAGNEFVRTMSYVESIIWVKENNCEKSLDLKRAYQRAGSAFRGMLAQTFVILS